MNRGKENKSVVLIGYIGSGKTSIFNKCCKKNQKVDAGGESVTRQTFMTESAYGNGFRVLDTPGFGTFSDKISHTVGILNALAEGPLSQIILILKFERLDIMEMFLKPMIQNQFKRFKQMITVLVTYWDEAEKCGKEVVEKRKIEIRNLLIKYGVSSLIFSSLNSDGKYLCSQIDQVLLNANNQKVELTETEIYSYFDLIEVNEKIEDELRDEKEKVRLLFKKKTAVIKKFISNFDENNPIMTELMHALTLEIKNYADEVIIQFERANNVKFTQLFEKYNEAKVAYLIDTQLKLELMEDVNQVMKLTQDKMKKFTKHCFNFIKRCPYCKEVWIKVSGCDGQTTCGNFPEKDELNTGELKSTLKFRFTFTDTQVEFEQIKRLEGENINQVYKLQENNKIGCGRQIVWKEIPALDDQQIAELLDPGILDYLAKEIPKDIEMNLKKCLQQEIENRKKELKVQRI